MPTSPLPGGPPVMPPVQSPMAFGSGSTPSRSRSPLPWQILSGVLAIALIVAVIVTLTNTDNGTQWKTRAVSAESLAQQLQTKMKASEASATALQARTVKLAAEKAKVEDNAKVQSLNVTIAKSLSDKLNDCTDRLQTVFGELVSAQSQSEIARIEGSDLQQTFNVCDQAASAADGFSQYLADNAGS